ncbi:glycoside hydrolase family 6 protein [Streptomyces sp900105755]|uniref:glycoside hydrolase family 6 protein n=1 Tax=Streptomyces sp. 900105755 TaxID=3154389 RepID=UPI0033190797
MPGRPQCGWKRPGGSAPPSGGGATHTEPSDGSREKRCTQRPVRGAGGGTARPATSDPAAGIDAYVWMKPPGESDGSSAAIPNDEGKGFDQMCDPTYTGNARNGNNMSGALPNAPLSGHWFSARFQQLMANAYLPLS